MLILWVAPPSTNSRFHAVETNFELHSRHPTDEQFRRIDISSNNNLPTVCPLEFLEPASVVRIVNSSVTAIEGNSFNVICKPGGDPKLIVYWTKEGSNQRINGSVLNFNSINRNDNGTYRCRAANDCGSDSRVEIITVSRKY